MLTDLHNHTCHFSPDAKMTIDELIIEAIKKNLNIVGITEHYEYDNPDPNDNIQTFDLDEYAKVFPEWKARCPSSLLLLKGIEFGYQKHTADTIDRIAIENSFDVVNLSKHLFRGVDLCFSNEAYQLDRITRHKEYIGEMAEMAERMNNFSVCSHYDYVNKYNKDPYENVLYEDCPKEFDRLFEALIYKEKALEINTATSVNRNQKPDPEVIKRYLSMGGKLITLASDAHIKENLGTAIPDFAEFLKSLGVREVCYYKAMRPVTTSI